LHSARADGALLPPGKIGDVENPARDKLVEPGSGLRDAGKQLGFGVRPRRSRALMSPRLTRVGGFHQAAMTVFSNDLSNAACERNPDRAVPDSGALNDSLYQLSAFGRQPAVNCLFLVQLDFLWSLMARHFLLVSKRLGGEALILRQSAQSFAAAFPSRRRCASRSRPSPSSSTAPDQSIEINISPWSDTRNGKRRTQSSVPIPAPVRRSNVRS
jgi:hypothetical protein